ncbi:MAG TPA: hypothetical protein VK008_07155 [Sphingobacteriaceae bacterium]|nr:hypothetical protein [Sphingobacteriaceae bacterium]
MKMEKVQELLNKWGELIIYTSGGQVFEIHIGDTQFDTENRLIHLQGPDSKYVIDGDSIEVVKQHYGHQEES